MRRLVPFAALLAAGCATAPPTPPAQPQPQPRPVPVQPRVPSAIIGLTAGDLVQQFGRPALQIREGPGFKLQFRSRECVLDAYLYAPPGGQGTERVTHVDTRVPSGADINQLRCINSFAAS